MTTNPQASQPELWSDRVDLDDLFRDAQPVEDLSELAIPGFFESDEEFDDFQVWLRAQRAADLG